MAAESYWQNRQPGQRFLKKQLSPASSVVANRLARAMLRSQKLKLVTLTDASGCLDGDSTLQSAVVANQLAYAMLRSELKLEPHARPLDFPDGDSILKSAKASLASPAQSLDKYKYNQPKRHFKRRSYGEWWEWMEKGGKLGWEIGVLPGILFGIYSASTWGIHAGEPASYDWFTGTIVWFKRFFVSVLFCMILCAICGAIVGAVAYPISKLRRYLN